LFLLSFFKSTAYDNSTIEKLTLPYNDFYNYIFKLLENLLVENFSSLWTENNVGAKLTDLLIITRLKHPCENLNSGYLLI